MSDCYINWRFGTRHFQIHKNRPYITFSVNHYWVEHGYDTWFERY